MTLTLSITTLLLYMALIVINPIKSNDLTDVTSELDSYSSLDLHYLQNAYKIVNNCTMTKPISNLVIANKYIK